MAEFSYKSPAKTRISPKTIRRRRLIFIVPAVFLILLFLYVVGYKASVRQRELRDYLEQTNKIALKSNKVADKLRSRLEKPSAKSDISSYAELADMIQDSTNLSDYAQSMIVPERLQQVHSYFIMSMKLRNKGMVLYKPAITGKSKSTKIQKKKIENALKYLAFSDLAYETFEEELKNIIKGDKIGIKIVKSRFISGGESIQKLKNIKKENKKDKDKEINEGADIAVDDVATEPPRLSINPDTKVRVLPLSNSINVRIRVKNNGEKDLTDIPVEVKLVAEGRTGGETKKSKINKIPAKGIVKITIEGFSPFKDILNILQIKLGPIKNEKNKSDNSYQYKFLLRDISNQVQNNQPQDGGTQDGQSQATD